MRVLITGATGFIGRALVPILRNEGHRLIALVRSEERARSLLGAEVETVTLSSGAKALREALEEVTPSSILLGNQSWADAGLGRAAECWSRAACN